MSKKLKPKRPLTSVLSNFYQTLNINTKLTEPIWQIGSKSNQPQIPNSLTVGLWNIFKGNGGTEFNRDYRHFIQHTDLCLLQEVLATQHGLGDYVPESWLATHAGSYERRDGLREGVMTLAKFAAERSQRILSPFGEPLVKTPKAALMTHYSVDHKDLMVVNLHLPLFRSIRRFEHDIKEMIGPAWNHEGPLLVAGDFNTFSLTYFKCLEACLADLGLEYARIPWDNRANIGRLDHIFTRGLKVTRIKVCHEIRSSDHFPILCHLIID